MSHLPKMKQPQVSVCLPNLNTRPYLEERVDSIFAQTHANWEMIVSDNLSEDGAWEFFQDLARKDSRVSIAQAPRRGMYENWNNCIQRATGKYVYIATSDDTMAPDCLEKLVAALEEHPECDLAHCLLVVTDKHSSPVRDLSWSWPDCTAFVTGIQELLNVRHVRHAPHDGLLHLTRRMVYTSITQLLIRRSLFSKIGGFESRWGSIGDLNWEMRAGLVANTVHVPDTWASFRVHPTQATASVRSESDTYATAINEMILDAVSRSEPFLAPAIVAGLRDYWLDWSLEMYAYYRALRNEPDVIKRRIFQARHMLRGTRAARAEVMGRLLGKEKWEGRAPSEIRAWLQGLGIDPLVCV